MEESPSNNKTIVEAGEGAVGDPIAGPASAREVVLTEDGVPVVDLRAAAEDGVLVVVDGELMLRLAEGTEWPVDTTSADRDIVLQVAEEGFIAASSIQAALADTGTALPLANLAQSTADAREPVADDADAVEPADGGEAPVRGGAPFRTFEIGELGQGLDPLLILGRSTAAGNPLYADLDGLRANTPGNGSRFINLAPIANDDFATTSERQSIDIDVLANDRGPHSGDQIRIVGVQAEGLSGVVTLNADGTLNYDPNGQFAHLGVGKQATEIFRYMISDQHGATDIATVEILIYGVNDAPVAVDGHFVGYETVGFYTPIASLLANDYDVDQGDTIHFAGLGNEVNGQVALTQDGYVVFTPMPGHVGPAGFLYAIEDQHGAYDNGEVHVDVQPITPGVIEYQTLSWFAGLSEATRSVGEDGALTLDLILDVAAVVGAGMEIGSMPFFSATLSGTLLGTIEVTIGPEGEPFALGDLFRDLDLDIDLSPIFQPLGSEMHDALFALTEELGSSAAENTPPLALVPLADGLSSEPAPNHNDAFFVSADGQGHSTFVSAEAIAIAEQTAMAGGDGAPR